MSITLNELLEKPPIKYRKLKPEEIDRLSEGKGAVTLGGSESAITNATSLYPILGMSGTEPCTGVYLYNRAAKTMAAWHMTTTSEAGAERLIDIAKHMRTDKQGVVHEEQPIDVTLVGGGLYKLRTSEKAAEFKPLLEALNAIPNIKVVHADIMDKPHPDAHSMDARTGKMVRGGMDGTPERPFPKFPRDAAKQHQYSFVDTAEWQGIEDMLVDARALKPGVITHDLTVPQFQQSLRRG